MSTGNTCLAFAGRAVLTNWQYDIKFNRTAGLTAWFVDLSALSLLVALIAGPIFLVRCYRLLRLCLDRGVKTPKTRKFIDWRPCLLLYPLLCHVGDTSTGFASDGALYTRSFSYGSDAGIAVFVASFLLIILYQFYAGLKSAIEGESRPGRSNSRWLPQAGV